MSILIKNIQHGNGSIDVLIKDNIIEDIAANINATADIIIDGTNKAIVPSFFNAHTHAAMTLLRSYADDMRLMDWLENAIWPLEAKLTANDIYWGTKLACLEMIKTGTTTFVDMYYHQEQVVKAAEEMGIRSLVSSVIFDHFNPELAKKVKQSVEDDFARSQNYSDRMTFCPAPHAIYTVSKETLQWVAKFSKENNLHTHIHLSETEFEVAECIKNNGVRPVRYLADMGFLSDKVIAAHCLHLSDDDIKILADYDVKVAHNPISNMKLASGKNFRYRDLKNAGVKIGIGSDGTASNNNLDMLESVKVAALWQKQLMDDPTVMNAQEAMDLITTSGEYFTGKKIGKIEKGYLADLCIVNLRMPEMLPNHNYISNLIYSANGSAVGTVICDGKIVMQNRKVNGEDEIYDTIPKITESLLAR